MTTKFTMVTVRKGTATVTTFAHLPVDEHGKAHASPTLINAMLAYIGVVERGVTFTLG